jgi:hypothetical protein
MDWIRLDVAVLRDPKVMGTGWEGALLYIWGLTYAGEHETDGVIPTAAMEAVPRWLKRPATVATKLVSAGLWESAKDGWRIHNFTKRQPTRAELEARRKAEEDRRRAEAERKAKWRAGRQSHGTDPGTPGGTDPGTSQEVSHGTSAGSPLLDTKTIRDGTGQTPESLGSVIDGLVSPEGGSGGKPDMGDPEQIPEGLNETQAHLWRTIVRKNRVFMHVWPGLFMSLEQGLDANGKEFQPVPTAAISDALSYLAHPDTDLSGVDHPRAYIIQTVREHAEKLAEKVPKTGPKTGPKTVAK